MTIINLSLVSKTLKKLIENVVMSSSAWNKVQPPAVSIMPPDKLKADSLGLYLYHVCEDPALKNQPPTSSSGDPTPVRYTPMALNLHFLLTTDAQVDTDDQMEDAQLLMGLAIKALHDYPLLTDNTVINTKNIFEEAGIDKTDTKLKITMQPTPYNEAVSYWTAGQSPLRLSAYYSVSVVLLEPEEPPTRIGRVLDYGVHTFISGAPKLSSSKNVLTVTIPDSGVSQDIELRPAEVPLGSRFELLGVNLNGDETELVLNNSRWSVGITADMGWGVIATDDRIIAVTQNQIDGTDILPGIYTAKALVSENRTMPDSSIRNFTNSSNETPFTITPRIDNVGNPDLNGNLTVNGFRFEHAEIDAEDVAVYISTEELTVGTAGALNPGEYAITDVSTLTLRLPVGTTAGFVPFRLIIHGAECAPAWVEVP
jgi:hypothetical protein